MARVMIIPAAGAGSRLGMSNPKVLIPVHGRPLIDHLFERYDAYVDSFVVVVHPSFEEMVRRHCEAQGRRAECVLQEHLTGMLDAILIPCARLRRRAFDDVWITWCDQIAVRPETVASLGALCASEPDTELIFPTVRRHRPYIHLVRNEAGEIVEVLHAREGDLMPEVGESDLGLFRLSRRAYLRVLPQFARTATRSAATAERNFLPFIGWLREHGTVRTFPGQDEMESIGVNTPEELKLLEAHLRRA
jgi:bifunctional UDP-N-acetylglucosamine pyrophosphorylase / glucosamine-1-phosphate N-acetyltransferase